MDLEKIRQDTPGLAHGPHLLAAGSSLMPQPVIDAIVNHTILESKIGGYEAHAEQAEMLDRIYDAIAAHIGAEAHEIAIAENATVAWCQAFYALDLPAGSRILTCEAEYAANYVALLQRAKKQNLKIEVVPSDDAGALDLTALEAMIDESVALIATTWIPTNGGLVNPAAGIGAIAREYNVPFLLDACQAVGQMPVNVAELGCDFLSATGRKFLRGPRGIGFLYVAEKWLDRLEPAMIDHFGAPWVAREQYRVRSDARRFETWENSYALRAGLVAALDYADAIGIDAIRERAWRLAAFCREQLSRLPGLELHDLGHDKCAIVSFTIAGLDPRHAVETLGRQGIRIGASDPPSTRIDAERRKLPDMLRAAPHYYNTEDDILQMVQALRRLASG